MSGISIIAKNFMSLTTVFHTPEAAEILTSARFGYHLIINL